MDDEPNLLIGSGQTGTETGSSPLTWEDTDVALPAYSRVLTRSCDLFETW